MFQPTHPLSLQQIFCPPSTGSPRQDVYNHISRLPQTARMDFEDHSLAGNLIVRIEPDLGSATEQEAQAKIVSVPYAERIFGNLADAVEFIRSVKRLAGEDAHARDFQSIASHYYKEAKARPSNEVLKELGLLAMQLSSVTATEEERAFGDSLEFEVELRSDSYADETMSPNERRTEWMRYAARVLGEAEEADIFETELRTISRFKSHTSSFVTDEFKQHLADCEAFTETAEEADALYQSYEASYEQYDEDHIVSLHMSDGERVVVAGCLDDDNDEHSLPEGARHLAAELHDLYTNGFPLRDRGPAETVEGVTLTAFTRDPDTRERVQIPVIVYGIDTWIDRRVDELFSERTTRTIRHFISVTEPRAKRRRMTHESVIPYVEEVEIIKRGRTSRIRQIRHRVRRVELSIPSSRLHEQVSTIEVCPHTQERERTRGVLEVLLTRLKGNYHTRGQHLSAVYRELSARISPATDTALVARMKKEAWDHKEAGRLSLKLFTALNTQASVRQSLLETEPPREKRAYTIVRGANFTMTKTFTDESRSFIVAQPLINEAKGVGGKTIADFARRLNSLPRQERERVRLKLKQQNPGLYARVRDGLLRELERASAKKLGYFRWAFYPGNKPEHPVHTLTGDDQAAAWTLLKLRSDMGAASATTIH